MTMRKILTGRRRVSRLYPRSPRLTGWRFSYLPSRHIANLTWLWRYNENSSRTHLISSWHLCYARTTSQTLLRPRVSNWCWYVCDRRFMPEVGHYGCLTLHCRDHPPPLLWQIAMTTTPTKTHARNLYTLVESCYCFHCTCHKSWQYCVRHRAVMAFLHVCFPDNWFVYNYISI